MEEGDFDRGDEIPWGLDGCRGSALLLLDECYGNGDFVWFHLLIKMIRDGRKVMLIVCDYTAEHLDYVLRKSSIDLRRREVSCNVCIKFLVPDLAVVSQEEKDRVQQNQQYYDTDIITWDALLAHQEAAFKVPAFKDNRFSLLLDNLSRFQDVAPSEKVAQSWINRVLWEINKPRGSVEMLVAMDQVVPTGSSNSTYSNKRSNQDYAFELELSEMLKYKANVLVTVSSLSTGFSNDIHGMVRLSANVKGQLRDETRTFTNVNSNQVVCRKLIVR